jgi:hypothetical protein
MGFRKRAISGVRNSRIVARVTSKLGGKVEDYWRNKTFPDAGGVQRHFKSKAEFLEYVLSVLVSNGEQGWKMFSDQKLKPVFL